MYVEGRELVYIVKWTVCFLTVEEHKRISLAQTQNNEGWYMQVTTTRTLINNKRNQNNYQKATQHDMLMMPPHHAYLITCVYYTNMKMTQVDFYHVTMPKAISIKKNAFDTLTVYATIGIHTIPELVIKLR